MKKICYLFVASLLVLSCQKPSELSSNFNCNTNSVKNLQEYKDFKKQFSIQYPKNWKTNLFYDDVQSSIYTADTTKQLTKTLLLDVTYINKEVYFDDIFKLKQEQESLSQKLIQTKSKEITLLNKPSYYTISKGKKGDFLYQICKVFIKINNENFIFAKTEIYGDSLVNERMCKGFQFIEKIKTHQ